MKRCGACGESKLVSAFSRNTRAADGRYATCKPCAAIVKRRYRENNAEKIREARKNYYEARPDMRNTWGKAHPERLVKSVVKWQKANSEKLLAHKAVYRALKNGVLTRRPCQHCGNPKVEAHHPDYGRQLDVVWLCRQHHKQLHTYSTSYTPSSC